MSFFIELTTKNFTEASKIDGNKEFRFVIGSKELFCHKFVAAFLSPAILRTLLSDPTTNSFCINTEPISVAKQSEINSKNEDFILAIVSKLIKGESIEINEEEIQIILKEIDEISPKTDIEAFSNMRIYLYYHIFKELGNEELSSQFYSQILQFIKQNNPNKTLGNKLDQFNTIDHLSKLFECRKANQKNRKESIIKNIKKYLSTDYSTFIDEISSHFFELKENQIVNMNSSILEDVLRSTELTVNDEDSLLNFLLIRRSRILQEIEINDENQELTTDDFFLQYVHYELLSEKGISNFLSAIRLTEIEEQTWLSIEKRLILPVKQNKINNRKNKMQQFFYNNNNEFNGIIQHLNEMSNGNVVQNKTIEIKCGDFCCGSIENLVNFNCKENHVHIRASSNRWIEFDFKNHQIQINSYLMKSSKRNVNDCLINWRVEISNDEKEWEKVDEQNNVNELNGQNLIKLFNIEMTKPFRFIRFFTDKPGNEFEIGQIEFFGQIIE